MAREEWFVPRSVLIVDDHEAIRRGLRSLFRSHPEFCVCGEAVDGIDAIEKAQQLSPDLVILDLAMPEMNGLEAAAALKYLLPDVPLFLLTAHYNRELELAATASGVCAVFSKHDCLESMIERARSELHLEPSREDEPQSQNGSTQ
jgi:DNA-binding NarL/FixJ family response regulator